MEITLTTRDHTDYVSDKVTFTDDGHYVEIEHDGGVTFAVRKSELAKVLAILKEDE